MCRTQAVREFFFHAGRPLPSVLLCAVLCASGSGNRAAHLFGQAPATPAPSTQSSGSPSNRAEAEEIFRQAERMTGTADESSERQIALLEKALQLDPDLVAADFNLGIVFTRLSNPARALIHFNRVLGKTPPENPTYKNALYLSAVNLKALGKTDEAIASAGRVIEIDPKHTDALSFLGSLYLDEGKTDQARETFERAIQADPTFAQGYYSLAFLAQAMGETDRALEYYQKFADLLPSDSKVQLNTAVLLAGADKMQLAARYAERAVQANPADPDAWTELGKIQSVSDERDKALESFSRSVALRPKWSEAHRLLALRLVDAKKINEAEKFLAQAEKESPDEAELHALKGLVATRQNNALFVLKGYARAYELDPSAPRAFDFAMAYAQTGALPLAEDYLVKAVTMQPDFLEAWVNLGTIRDRLHKTAEALAAYREAETRGVRDGILFYRIGMLYARAADTDNALQYLKRAIDSDPPRWKAVLKDQLKAVTSDLDSVRYKPEFQKLLE